jgi:hypothetical protein
MASRNVHSASEIPRLLSTSGAGRRIGVTKAHVVRLANEGKLPVFATLEGGNEARVFTEAQVERFIEQREARRLARETRHTKRARVAVV